MRPWWWLASGQRKGWWHAKKAGKAGGAASKRTVTFLVLADCLLLPPSRSPDALFIITIHSTLCTLGVMMGGQRKFVAQQSVQAMLLSGCRWWLGASGPEGPEGGWVDGGMRRRFYPAGRGTIKWPHANISSSNKAADDKNSKHRRGISPSIHMRSVCRALTVG